MCVLVFICTCVYTSVCIPAFLCVCIYKLWIISNTISYATRTSKYLCPYVSICIYVHTHVFVCVCVCERCVFIHTKAAERSTISFTTCTNAYVYIHSCVYTYIRMFVCVCVRVCVHTYIGGKTSAVQSDIPLALGNT